MKRTVLSILALAAIAALLTGCRTIPAVSARSIHYESSYPIGGSTIDATGVVVTDTHVKVEKYSRKSRWWYVNQDVRIEGYERARTAGQPPIISEK